MQWAGAGQLSSRYARIWRGSGLGVIRALGPAFGSRCGWHKVSVVPYDEDLANRIRELIGGEPELTEKKMFGGLAFLIGGNMSIAVSHEGGLLLRCDPAETDALLAKPHARPMVMRGREMDGWLRVDTDGVATKRQLAPWVTRGVTYARTLPPKG